jgi:hypothetical protein
MRAKEYAAYRGDELIGFGTAREIAEKMGVTIQSLNCYKSPSRKSKTVNYENQYFFVDVTNIEEDNYAI